MRRRPPVLAPGARGLVLLLGALVLGGCALPSWVPLVGRSGAPKAGQAPAARPEPQRSAPLLRPDSPPPVDPEAVVDRVITVVNNDAVTQSELDENERFYLYETGATAPPEGEERRALRARLLERLIENRLQLQQAEREKTPVEEAEVEEQLGVLMKKLGVGTPAALEAALRPHGLTVEGFKKRIREQVMVQKLVRRRVTLRVSVTEQEIDRYLEANREKLETGLTFEARHILLLPEAGSGEDGWERARRRAEELHARLLGGEDFAELARAHSQDGSARDGGALGTLKRGELAPEIERAILGLRPGEVSPPFRSGVGYHLFKLETRQVLAGEALVQARNQIRDILYREKHQARLREWLSEIRQRAVIDIRM